jgi:ABC-type polysaccharide/polyol phosphate export permease
LLHSLRQLLRHRALVQSLVSRELKARYRGSVLGFFWSFVNPLLLLLTYTLVFTVILPGRQSDAIQPYFLFFFTGILPWTWFSSSLAESSGVLISSGNLIKKVLFPAEVLPVVSVLSNMVHFGLGLLILAAFMIATRHPPDAADLLFLPLVVLVQLVLTLGLALVLSALTVHFRDLRDLVTNLLTFWFFATPIIYPYYMPTVARFQRFFDVNPFFHIAVSYQEILFFYGPFWQGHLRWLAAVGVASCAFFVFAYWLVALVTLGKGRIPNWNFTFGSVERVPA